MNGETKLVARPKNSTSAGKTKLGSVRAKRTASAAVLGSTVSRTTLDNMAGEAPAASRRVDVSRGQELDESTENLLKTSRETNKIHADNFKMKIIEN